ncbi:hypothetical protein [Agromyces atrinae]|uniref:Uncharacterized protein n=1 Tax=Agromyces atrinae TaxID=592376 RepID=A0A4Q2M248_9MICO|nr:hypothetical protein [Agromyces atrinae]NYD68794.1 hypothetical protein [Agromyces atrinae]RXZ85091.1 hypothetical protein ESP50_17110 [Agromyces atrinae]RXZ85828.1 hypothetical protein ESP50_13635 [Agromyces atrinae]
MSENPELDGYEPTERPIRSRGMIIAMRVTVSLALGALLLPAVIVGVGYTARTADSACRVTASVYAPGAASVSTRFEFGPSGLGWQCFAVTTSHGERRIAELGLIPSAPTFRGDEIGA